MGPPFIGSNVAKVFLAVIASAALLLIAAFVLMAFKF
jgi:hypothetical protein